MKYAIRYFKGSRQISNMDEIIIKYTEKHTEASLISFLESRPQEQRIVIDMSLLPEDIVMLNLAGVITAIKVHKNLAVLFDATFQRGPAAECYEENIPFFYCNRCNSFDTLYSFIQEGVSDIYITDELGFHIEAVSSICHESNVKVRVFPNVAQSSSIIPIYKGMTRFFIRPEDEFIYDEYIDIYEFYGPLVKQDVYYKIYKSHRWMGSLRYLIINLNEDIYSDRLLPHFGKMRSHCDKRCNLGRCELCPAMSKMAIALKESDESFSIKVDYPKDYNEKDVAILTENTPIEEIDDSEDFSN